MSYLPFIVESTRPKAVGTAAKTVACKVFDAHQRLVEGSVVHRQTCNDQVRVIMGTPYTEELDQMVYCSMVYYNINNSFEPRLKLDVAKALTIEHGTFGFGHVSISGDFHIYQRNQLVQ